MATREERIRERAEKIWEAEGQPEGRADHHWQMAANIIDQEDARQGDATLDDALDQTFPASDPPAQTQPTTSVAASSDVSTAGSEQR